MIYEAILFDMDGVVVDTRQSVTAFWQNLAAEHRVRLTPEDFDRHVYGCQAGDTFDRFFPTLDPTVREAVFGRLVAYETRMAYAEIPGAVAILRRLRRFGIPAALVTSGEDWKIDEVARQLGLDGLFAARVSGIEVERGKPYPDGYLLGAKKLHRPPETCIVFEDAVSGVRAAVAAATLCIGVQSPEHAQELLAAGASTVIPDFNSIQLLPANNPASRWILEAGQEKLALGPC